MGGGIWYRLPPLSASGGGNCPSAPRLHRLWAKAAQRWLLGLVWEVSDVSDSAGARDCQSGGVTPRTVDSVRSYCVYTRGHMSGCWRETDAGDIYSGSRGCWSIGGVRFYDCTNSTGPPHPAPPPVCPVISPPSLRVRSFLRKSPDERRPRLRDTSK